MTKVKSTAANEKERKLKKQTLSKNSPRIRQGWVWNFEHREGLEILNFAQKVFDSLCKIVKC